MSESRYSLSAITAEPAIGEHLVFARSFRRKPPATIEVDQSRPITIGSIRSLNRWSKCPAMYCRNRRQEGHRTHHREADDERQGSNRS